MRTSNESKIGNYFSVRFRDVQNKVPPKRVCHCRPQHAHDRFGSGPQEFPGSIMANVC